ncbi:MAG TPA: DUF1993 domain-containing protein [Devosiaceae bacterium]|jgi:hypothetical protein
MTFTIYQASVSVFTRALGQLNSILDKAAANAEARKIDLDVFVCARLAPDMLPLSAQIQMASDTAKAACARLAGVEVPSWADEEKTFAELKERIAKTVAFLESLDANKFDGAEDKSITLKMRSGEVQFNGADFLLKRQIPNFFFHITTAYDILRANGVDIGKRDYLGT